MIVGIDAKRIVRNGTGLGSYGRTLVNDLIRMGDSDMQLRLYAPDEGRDELRGQIIGDGNVQFCYPNGRPSALRKAWWRSRGVVESLKRDGVNLYHGLSGELPVGLRKNGIRSVVTIHDLIFLRHPEFYNWLDAKIYAYKFRATCREATRIIAISERTRQDIIELGGEEYADRIELIYQSFAPRFSSEIKAERKAQVREHYKLPQRFVLNVGTIEELRRWSCCLRTFIWWRWADRRNMPDRYLTATVSTCSAGCPTTTWLPSMRWLRSLSILHVTRDSAFLLSRPLLPVCR